MKCLVEFDSSSFVYVVSMFATDGTFVKDAEVPSLLGAFATAYKFGFPIEEVRCTAVVERQMLALLGHRGSGEPLHLAKTRKFTADRGGRKVNPTYGGETRG